MTALYFVTVTVFFGWLLVSLGRDIALGRI